MEESSSDTDGNAYERPCVSSRGMKGRSRSALGRGSRRPDKAIYVPRALRQSEYEARLSSFSCSLSLGVSEESSSDIRDLPSANHEPVTDSADESDAAVRIAGVEPVDCDQTLSYFMAMTLEEAQTDPTRQNTEETDDFYHEVHEQIHTVPFTGHDCTKKRNQAASLILIPFKSQLRK